MRTTETIKRLKAENADLRDQVKTLTDRLDREVLTSCAPEPGTVVIGFDDIGEEVDARSAVADMVSGLEVSEPIEMPSGDPFTFPQGDDSE